MMKKLGLLVFAGLTVSSAAYAGSIAVTPGSGTTVGAGTDGTNQIPAAVICGATSGNTLYATCANQAFVNASGQLGIAGPVTQSGTWNITNVSGTVSLPTGASTAANQTNVQGASGATYPTTLMSQALRAQNAEATAVTNGQSVAPAADLVGKLINQPYANKENMVRGSASQTSTAATTIIATQGVGIKIYVTAVECFNTSSATTYVTLNDSASTIVGVPASSSSGGGNNMTFPVPLVVAANTALQFTPAAGTTTLYCNAQGYSGV